jgi:8-oxo-dGTP pyrophosphatase MutT (NUDIX family)
MSTSVSLMLLTLVGTVLLVVVLIALRRRGTRRKPSGEQPTVARSVVYLVSGTQLLVMQQARKGHLRPRLEVPKGKLMRGETALAAARRECWEESGLRPTALHVLTSFHIPQRNGKHRGMETWMAFWGIVPAGTATPFMHRVGGKGRDRGRMYQYRLVPLEAAVLHPPLDVPLPALRAALAKIVGG